MTMTVAIETGRHRCEGPDCLELLVTGADVVVINDGDTGVDHMWHRRHCPPRLLLAAGL